MDGHGRYCEGKGEGLAEALGCGIVLEVVESGSSTNGGFAVDDGA